MIDARDITLTLTLSTAIDHIQSLLSEQQVLLQRLSNARSTLSAQNPGHPALNVSPEHTDVNVGGHGVALWEREWTGGTGWGNDDEMEE